MITVTASAVKQLRQMQAEHPATGEVGLRLSVENGGCAGMQYGMAFGEPGAEDVRIPADDLTLFVESGSAQFLAGCTLDYEDGLTGSGFRIHNPNAVRSCGCGTSFEPARSA